MMQLKVVGLGSPTAQEEATPGQSLCSTDDDASIKNRKRGRQKKDDIAKTRGLRASPRLSLRLPTDAADCAAVEVKVSPRAQKFECIREEEEEDVDTEPENDTEPKKPPLHRDRSSGASLRDRSSYDPSSVCDIRSATDYKQQEATPDRPVLQTDLHFVKSSFSVTGGGAPLHRAGRSQTMPQLPSHHMSPIVNRSQTTEAAYGTPVAATVPNYDWTTTTPADAASISALQVGLPPLEGDADMFFASQSFGMVMCGAAPPTSEREKSVVCSGGLLMRSRSTSALLECHFELKTAAPDVRRERAEVSKRNREWACREPKSPQPRKECSFLGSTHLLSEYESSLRNPSAFCSSTPSASFALSTSEGDHDVLQAPIALRRSYSASSSIALDDDSLARIAITTARLSDGDRSFMDSSIDSGIEGKSDSRHRKSQAKWRRISNAWKGRVNENPRIPLTPGTALRTNSSTAPQVRLEGSMPLAGSEDLCEMRSSSPTMKSPFDGRQHVGFLQLRMPSKWRVPLIGGLFQMSFVGGEPVIRLPGGLEDRCCHSYLRGDRSLHLVVVDGYRALAINVVLSPSWKWVRCFPTGYIVYDPSLAGSLLLDDAREAYFLHTLPIDCGFGQHITESVSSELTVIDRSLDAADYCKIGPIRWAKSMHTISDKEKRRQRYLQDIEIVTAILQFLLSGNLDGHLRTGRKISGSSVFSEYSWCLTMNKAFSIAYQCLRARFITTTKIAISNVKFNAFMSSQRSCTFISNGACKSVYKIEGKAEKCQEQAMAILDLDDLKSRGVHAAVDQETEISLTCSALSASGICPNFTRVTNVFYSSSLPKEVELKRKGNFQYICMELCGAGDAEEYLRKVGNSISCDFIRCIMFQILIGLFTGREQLFLQHYDIKLLNIFLTFSAPGEKAHMNYSLGNKMFSFPLATSEKDKRGFPLAKLADFGTSSIGSRSLGCPIEENQVSAHRYPIL